MAAGAVWLLPALRRSRPSSRLAAAGGARARPVHCMACVLSHNPALALFLTAALSAPPRDGADLPSWDTSGVMSSDGYPTAFYPGARRLDAGGACAPDCCHSLWDGPCRGPVLTPPPPIPFARCSRPRPARSRLHAHAGGLARHHQRVDAGAHSRALRTLVQPSSR